MKIGSDLQPGQPVGEGERYDLIGCSAPVGRIHEVGKRDAFPLVLLPPCMPFPRALTGFPVSSTAKVMYCRMLDAMLSNGQEDENGILFVCFPVTAIAAVLSRSPMTVKRSLNELETAGLIMRVRQGVGEPNRIYVLIPGKEDAAPVSYTHLDVYKRQEKTQAVHGWLSTYERLVNSQNFFSP